MSWRHFCRYVFSQNLILRITNRVHLLQILWFNWRWEELTALEGLNTSLNTIVNYDLLPWGHQSRHLNNQHRNFSITSTWQSTKLGIATVLADLSGRLLFHLYRDFNKNGRPNHTERSHKVYFSECHWSILFRSSVQMNVVAPFCYRHGVELATSHISCCPTSFSLSSRSILTSSVRSFHLRFRRSWSIPYSPPSMKTKTATSTSRSCPAECPPHAEDPRLSDKNVRKCQA